MEQWGKGVIAVVLLLLVVVVFRPAITGYAIKNDDVLSAKDYGEYLEQDEYVEEEYTEEQMEADVKQVKTFFKFVGLLFNTDEKESGGCCTDISGLQQRVNDLESKVKDLEDRNKNSCTMLRLSSGSCQAACQAKSLHCASAINTRTKTEHPLIGNSYTVEVFSHAVACDYSWYMPNDPNLKDEIGCSCC
jgi:hypothetical protein